MKTGNFGIKLQLKSGNPVTDASLSDTAELKDTQITFRPKTTYTKKLIEMFYIA